jgi:diguanylate cyclase (GGDEF)-like protein
VPVIAGSFPHWLDLRRRGIRDAVVVMALASLVFIGAAGFAIGRWAFGLAEGAEAPALDIVLGVLLTCCVIADVFSVRRIRDMNAEIRARQLAEERLEALARHDPLTGLPNRAVFTERLAEVLRNEIGGGRRAAVLMLHIDRFGAVSERQGQMVGDQAMIEFARRIAASLEGDTLFARMGGGHFAILQPHVVSLDDATRLARRLVVAAAAPFLVGGAMMQLGANIGIAVLPDDGAAVEQAMRHAELALRRAKRESNSTVRFYEPEMDTYLDRRAQIERELDTAIAASAIVPHYQPIVSFETGRVLGFEALARWKSPSLGWIPPGTFLTVAEESGRMREVTDLLLQRACREAARWPDHVKLCFNLSSFDLHDRALALRIQGIVQEARLDPKRLELEVGASSPEELDMVREVAAELRRAGFPLALGGFGNGYASIAHLLDLRVDKIQVAHSIVARLGRDADSAVILRAIVALANSLKLQVSAHGIERPEQLRLLREAGFTQGQGFLFGKAVAAADTLRLVRHSTILVPAA